MTEAQPQIAALGERFIAELKRALTSREFKEVVRRNATPEYENSSSCASHDFCDANMVMEAAFIAVMGREPSFGLGTFSESSAEEEADAALWNEAWEWATEHGLRKNRS